MRTLSWALALARLARRLDQLWLRFLPLAPPLAIARTLLAAAGPAWF